MKLCFPVERNLGLESEVYGHFGSAPIFLILDTESGTVAEAINRDRSHAHGQCSPHAALDGKSVDAVIVGGIGPGALNGLTRAGISVHRAQTGTVGENLAKYLASALPRLEPGQASCGHGHGGGHGHHGGCAHG